MNKNISFRANEEYLNMLNDLKTWLDKAWKEMGVYKKVTISDVIFQAIINDWQKKCLPFTDQEKPYKYRAEKDIPYT